MESKSLKRHLEQRKDRIGLVGTSLEINEVPGNSFSAYITHDFMNISMDYGEDLQLIPDKETRVFSQKKQIQDPETKIGEDILEHEAGHRENPTETRYGCPYIVEIHDLLLDSITKALKIKGKKGLEHYVCNAFEDVLGNINCRRKTDFSGQTLFWNNQGLVNSENQKFSQFYEAFVKINLILGGNVQDTTLLRRFYKNDEKAQKSVRSFLNHLKSRLGIDSLIRLHEKGEFEILFNKNLEERIKLWEDLAYNFAINMADLLDKPPEEEMFGSSENPFDKELKIPKVRQEIAYVRYKSKKGPSTHRDQAEQLYDLYKKISREIPVETSHFEKSSEMPLVFYGRRFVNENDRKIRYRGIAIAEDGNLGIKTARHQINFPVAFKTNPVRFPKLKIGLIDRSSSMALNPENKENVGSTEFIPWGNNSKYHFALKGYFGIDNFFENQGVSQYIENCVLGFSGESAIRGKSEDVARKLLVKPEGGTHLDVDALVGEINQDSLVLSISDGEFDFNEEHKKRIREKIKQCDYAHIQIGQDNEFSRYLKRTGIPVFNVKGDNDLSEIMVTFVSEYYKSKSKTD